MPVIQIQALPQKEGVEVSATIKSMCCKVAGILDIPEYAVWATWNTVQPGQYVEGSKESKVQPEGTHPPIVDVVMFEGRSEEQIERVLNCIAEELSGGLKMEAGNVFITYREAKSGKVFTGGSVRRNI